MNGKSAQQDKVLDLAKLISKGSGINVAVQQNTTTTGGSSPSGGGSLDLLQQAANHILSTRRPLRMPSPDVHAALATPVVDASLVSEETDASNHRQS